MKKCNWCGAEIEDRENICNKCKARVSKSNPKYNKATVKKQPIKKSFLESIGAFGVIVIIFSVTIILLAITIGLINGGGSKDTEDSVTCTSCGRTYTWTPDEGKNSDYHNWKCISYSNMCKKCYGNYCYLNGMKEKDY